METTPDSRLAILANGQAIQQPFRTRAILALQRGSMGLPSLPLALWVIMFVCVPGGFALVYSFQTYTFFDVSRPWTLENYIDLFSAGSYARLFVKTAVASLIITVGAIAVASPMAYYLSRVASRRLGVVLLLLTVLPLWMNLIIRNYSWIALISTNGVLNAILKWFGLPTVTMIFTMPTVMVVGVTLALPFAVLILFATMGTISHEVEEASLDLGTSRLQTFRKVVFPLTGSGYQTAALLIFMPTLGFYLTPLMLGGLQGAMLGTVLMPIVKVTLDFAQGSAFVVPIVILLMGITYLLRRGINIDNLYRSGVGSSIARRTQRHSPWLLVYTVAIVFVTYLPLLSMVAFSFDKNPLAVLPLQGGTLQWYTGLLQNSSLTMALRNSVLVALETAFVVVALSAPAAYAVARYRFPGRGALIFMSLLPMLIPEIITGMAILILLSTFGVPLSLHAIVIGHATLALPFVFLTILAHQYAFDRTVEEAAQDLGATPLKSFGRVVLPLMVPALVAGAFLAITVSFNDFIVAFLLTGGATTMPIYIFGLLKAATSPSANAVGTLLILAVVLVMLIALFRPWRMVPSGVQRAGPRFLRLVVQRGS